jgi:hypothetical protein
MGGGEQVNDFWEDLIRLDDHRNHYTGQLTLEKVPDIAWQRWDEDTWLIQGRGYKPFYVVDGQQRLTTAIILIKCLLDRVEGDQLIAFMEKADHVKKYLVLQVAEVSRAYLFGYEKDNPSYEYLKTQILTEPSNQYQGTETTYTANLWKAREFFREKLANAPHHEIERRFKAITQKFLFNIYELVEDLDVFVVFETMNNRGKPLSRLELLKNRLIYLSTILHEPCSETDRQALRRNINDAWKTIFEYLGREKIEPLDDDDFLRAHWIMYFTFSREEAAQFSIFLLSEHFTTKRVDAGEMTASEIQRYVTSVQDSVRRWHEIHFPSRAAGLGERVRRCLERLDRLGRGAFEPLIMAALQKPNLDDRKIEELLESAERFNFVVSRLCQRRSNTGDSTFYRLAGRLFRREITLATATQVVRDQTTFFFSLEKATTEIRDLFQRADGFYSWSGLRYFLFEYEQHLKDRATLATFKLDWNEFTASKKDYVTIEHIYPVTPIAGEWPTFDDKPEDERKILRNSLGNLLPLSRSRNSKFSNRKFATKKQDADGITGYYNGSHSEIAVAQYPDWTPDLILARGLEMLDFLECRWKVPLGSRETKVKLLGLV